MTGHEQCRDLCHACDGAVISHEEIQVFRWCSALGHIQNASVAITWGGPVGTPRVHFMAMITTLRMVSMQRVAWVAVWLNVVSFRCGHVTKYVFGAMSMSSVMEVPTQIKEKSGLTLSLFWCG